MLSDAVRFPIWGDFRCEKKSTASSVTLAPLVPGSSGPKGVNLQLWENCHWMRASKQWIIWRSTRNIWGIYRLILARHFQRKLIKVIGYLVAKNILGFLCAHENYNFDNLFLLVLTTTFAVLLRVLGISHLNKTFHRGAEGLVALVFVETLLWLVKKRKPIRLKRRLAFQRSERREAMNVIG